MKTITKDDFLKLGTIEQMDYINKHALKYNGREWLDIDDNNNIIDIDSDDPVDNLFDYALELHYEATDVQGKLFLD